MRKPIFRLALGICAVAIAFILLARLGNSNQGDTARGKALYEGNMIVCFACHADSTAALTLDGIRDRVLDIRLKAPENTGKTPEQFLAESILFHGAYIAPDSPAYMMPTLYTRLLTLRDTQDLVAYLLTL